MVDALRDLCALLRGILCGPRAAIYLRAPGDQPGWEELYPIRPNASAGIAGRSALDDVYPPLEADGLPLLRARPFTWGGGEGILALYGDEDEDIAPLLKAGAELATEICGLGEGRSADGGSWQTEDLGLWFALLTPGGEAETTLHASQALGRIWGVEGVGRTIDSATLLERVPREDRERIRTTIVGGARSQMEQEIRIMGLGGETRPVLLRGMLLRDDHGLPWAVAGLCLSHKPTHVPAGKPPQRVLVVDDEELCRDLMGDILTNLGVPFDTASDGEQAIGLFKRGQYDLVLLDCKMPRKTGYEAARELRLLRPADPTLTILGLTAWTEPAERRRCLEAGMDHVMGKPFLIEEFERAVQAALGTSTEEHAGS